MFMRIAAVAALLLVASPAFAADTQDTRVVVDLSKLDSSARDKVLEAVKVEAPKVNAATVNEWAVAGKGIGDGIAAAAKALNTGVNDFIKTPAGVLTIWLIIGYLFGSQIVNLVLGPIVWALLLFGLWHIAKTFLRPNVRTLKDGTVVDRTFQWRSTDAKAFLGVGLCAVGALLSLLMLFIVFP